MKIHSYFFLFLFFIITGWQAIAQNNHNLWFRHTAISPDGTKIAFTYNADIYVISSKGGKATRLTSNPSYDTKPIWSHDGSKIAFASDRYGNFDVFVMNSEGGKVKRLTYYSADDWPTEFSNDNESVWFNSVRMDQQESMLYHELGELYSVNMVADLPIQLLSIPAYEAKINTGGDILFEEIKGYEDQFRKHHTSSVTRDIWIKKSSGEYKKLSTFEGENRNPVFGNEGAYFYLSEASGSFNVYQSSLNKPEVSHQISNFTMHPVRNLSISQNGLLCYSYNGNIYTQKAKESPTKIKVDVAGDESILSEELLFINGSIQEMIPSPNGKELIFIYRGDVFASTLEGGLTRRLTHTPEQERSIDISKDGRSIVFAGERNNSWNLYTLSLSNEEEKYFSNAINIKEEILLANSKETFQPKFSPDGKEIAYIEDRVALKKIDVTTKKITLIHNGEKNFSYSDGDQYFEWSPDGKWMAINFLNDQYWVSEIGVIRSNGEGKIINISKNGFEDINPKWTEEGDMLYWYTNKSGMQSVAKTGPTELDIYGVFLTQKAYDKFHLSKDEFSLLPDSTETEKEKPIEKDKKKSKKKEVIAKNNVIKPLVIDFDNIEKRKIKLSLFSTRLSGALIAKDMKKLYYLGKTADKADLWELNLRTKEIKSLGQFGSGGTIIFDKKGEHLYILSEGKISNVDLGDGKSEGISISTEMPFDLTKERLYLIDHVTRQVKKKFLDPNLHGAPWDSLSSNYRQFVPYINNDHDFKDILGELLGELNASHTGARFNSSNKKGDETASLGVFLDPDYIGNGIRILEIMDGSPLIRGEKKVTKGTIIEAIDGQKIASKMNFYPLLNRKNNVPITIAYFDPLNKERWKERLKPISISQENELRYQRWIDRNRELVHKLSNNQIGYMHVKNMSDQSYRAFLEDVLGEEVNKKALVVDTRSNGGGDLVDDLTTFLSGKKYMEFKTPHKIVGFESQRRWTKPSIMLIGEDNYSDAHCTPVAYKDLEIGKLVGMPVPGTCSFVWWERIQNGIVFGIPNMQVTDIKGDVLENKQLEPDILIKNQFDKVINGQDEQIEAAVKELMKEIK